ncbi:RHS repeat-associated core domain-containing protein [Flavobacterium sp. SUN046]|uniref:RHS repeat domain-containing protein n=1 Tax=Flavobacterium sp. SUN046 TaxID=3002440 RepID=UPI002DBB464E|nr:RHS repeat-associated core domain-containing protein [Flavobacterium sp. SUN046]MEC4048608.1 RHS repeat-associated core domain-containing protein [Flavobacterium sp. SUN046]
MGGYTNSKTQYSFIGQVLHTETEHKKNSSFVAITIKEDFVYSPQGRLIQHYHQIDDNAVELLGFNQYNNLGQLIHKRVGGANDVGLQKVDYSYNIRGWLKEINKLSDLTETNVPTDLFAFKINYNSVDNNLGGTVMPLYNGNISETFWKTSSDNVTRKYGYQYDALNRLNKATYQKPNFPVQVTNSYNEEISYDGNGNILNLRRNGELDDQGMALQIDDLVYSYDQNNPNRLIKVNDLLNNPSGFSNDDVTDPNDMNDDYKYDDYGNMIRDDNKNIKSIVYNHLNLPVLIDFGALGRISYIYNAVGQKISKKVMDANLNTTVETFYVDGFQYKGDNLQFFPHTEGYVNCNAPKLLLVPTIDGGLQEVYLDDGTPTFSYVYNYTDHLGNIRLSYTKNPQSGALSIIEENHYYPFGLKHNNYNSDKNMYAKEQEQLKIKPVPPLFKPAYNYKYNGKEMQDDLGLDLYDFGGRNYMPDIVRTPTQDPLSEKFTNVSPYSFLNNNPIYFVDPTGMAPDGWIKSIKDGATSYIYDTNVNTVKEAKEAGYENVADVQQGYNVSATNGSYSYNLNQDGSVTNASGGEVQFDNHIVADNGLTVGGAFQTGAGSKIFTSNLGKGGFNNFPKASGAIEQMDFSSPFFPAGMVFKSLGRAVITADGFLFGSLTVKSPFNIPVQRFGNMSFSKSDFWGLNVGSSTFVNRTFVAIKPEWNALNQYATGLIPKGTPIQFGIIGPQGLAYPGGSLQFIVNSNSVINQASSVIPR